MPNTFLAPDAQEQQLQQRQAFAQALMQQGMQGNGQTQMASNVAVRNSPISGFANMLSAYLGGKMNHDATQQLGALNDQKRQKTAELLRQGFDALKNGDQQGAAQTFASDPSLAPYAQEIMKGQISQQSQQAKPFDLGDVAKYDPASVARFRQTGNYGDLQLADRQASPLSEYQRRELELRERQLAQENGGNTDKYHPPIQTSSGWLKWDGKNGYVPMVDAKGNPYLPPGVDAKTQRDVAGAKAEGTATGTATGGAKANLDYAKQSVDEIDSTIDQLANHPGIKGITGVRGAIPNIPGSEAADAEALRQQLGGKVFLQARQALKGGGQITDYEGQKAEEAYARMQKAQSPEAFQKALQEYKQHVHRGFEILQKQASGNLDLPAVNARPPLSSFGG